MPILLVTGLIILSGPAPSAGEAQSGTQQSWAQLALARAKQQRGEYNLAYTILLAALKDAPQSPILLDALASAAQDLGKYSEAETSYLRALSFAASEKHNFERLKILNNLATLYLETDQQSQGEHIRQQLEALPSGLLEQHAAEAAGLLNVMGSLEHARNHDEDAERYYNRSLLLFRNAFGGVSIGAATAEANLAFLLLERGNYEAADLKLRRAIHEMEAVSGREAPELLRPWINLGRCENMLGRSEEAEQAAKHAVDLSVRIFGSSSGQPIEATAMLEEATALRRLGHKSSARTLEHKARLILKRYDSGRLSRYTISVRDLQTAKPPKSRAFKSSASQERENEACQSSPMACRP